MEFTEILPEFLKFIMTEGGFGSAILAFFLILFVSMYWMEHRKNQQLMMTMVKLSREDSDKYVEVISEASRSQAEIAASVDRLADHTINLTGQVAQLARAPRN